MFLNFIGKSSAETEQSPQPAGTDIQHRRGTQAASTESTAENAKTSNVLILFFVRLIFPIIVRPGALVNDSVWLS